MSARLPDKVTGAIALERRTSRLSVSSTDLLDTVGAREAVYKILFEKEEKIITSSFQSLYGISYPNENGAVFGSMFTHAYYLSATDKSTEWQSTVSSRMDWSKIRPVMQEQAVGQELEGIDWIAYMSPVREPADGPYTVYFYLLDQLTPARDLPPGGNTTPPENKNGGASSGGAGPAGGALLGIILIAGLFVISTRM